MDIQSICDQQWYLAVYITGGKNREKLFNWLADQRIIPWTPLTLTRIQRTDKPNACRRRINAVFPGYFFLKANFDYQNINNIRAHSAFCDFVKTGNQINPVNPSVVDALMKVYPDPSLQPAAIDELNSASNTWLTKRQYQHLLQLENTPHPVSRIAMLLELINQPASHGY